METMPPHETIAAVMHGWLAEEIRNSGSEDNKNKELDKWDTFMQNGMAKAKSHYNRLRLRTDNFYSLESADEFIALQIFDTQMGVSGAFRTQCRVMADDHPDYLARRYGTYPYEPTSSGINIGAQINERLYWHFGRMPSEGDFRMARVLPETLIAATNATNNLRLTTMERIAQDLDVDTPQNKVKHETRLKRLQETWVGLAVDYIVYAAQQRGGSLARVPMKEPKSITDGEFFYPFEDR
jgi:hypothetical protein